MARRSWVWLGIPGFTKAMSMSEPLMTVNMHFHGMNGLLEVKLSNHAGYKTVIIKGAGGGFNSVALYLSNEQFDQLRSELSQLEEGDG